MKSSYRYEGIGPVEHRSGANGAQVRLMSPEEQIAAFLREWRKTWRMTQTQLAQKAGTTQRVISFLEAGKYNPSLELLQRLAEACNMRLEVRYTRKQ